MIGTAIDGLEMDIGARASGEAFKEVIDQFRLKITDQPRFYFCINHCGRTPAEIYSCHAQGLIHGHHEVSGTHNAALVAKRVQERLTQSDTHVFHCMVLVHIQVTRCFELQVKSAMTREQLQHVIKKPDAGGDLIAAPAFNRQRKLNLRLRGFTAERCLSHRAAFAAGSCASTCFSSASKRSISGWVPIVMRTQPSQSGRSRSAMPRARKASRIAFFSSPKRQSRKLHWLGQHLNLSCSSSLRSHSRLVCTWAM